VNAVQAMVRYKAWADATFLAVIGALPEDMLVAPRPILFGNIIRTLNHSFLMDYAWQCHLLGKPHGLESRNPPGHPALPELIAAQRRIDAWYVDYTDGPGAQRLDEVVAFEFIGGGAGAMSRRDILLHVVNHTTYHRGHVADMLYDLGVFPPATDLPVFLREGCALPAGPPSDPVA
jgi:uncharacterized damage-inducible protein DinB